MPRPASGEYEGAGSIRAQPIDINQPPHLRDSSTTHAFVSNQGGQYYHPGPPSPTGQNDSQYHQHHHHHHRHHHHHHRRPHSPNQGGFRQDDAAYLTSPVPRSRRQSPGRQHAYADPLIAYMQAQQLRDPKRFSDVHAPLDGGEHLHPVAGGFEARPTTQYVSYKDSDLPERLQQCFEAGDKVFMRKKKASHVLAS